MSLLTLLNNLMYPCWIKIHEHKAIEARMKLCSHVYTVWLPHQLLWTQQISRSVFPVVQRQLRSVWDCGLCVCVLKEQPQESLALQKWPRNAAILKNTIGKQQQTQENALGVCSLNTSTPKYQFVLWLVHVAHMIFLCLIFKRNPVINCQQYFNFTLFCSVTALSIFYT